MDTFEWQATFSKVLWPPLSMGDLHLKETNLDMISKSFPYIRDSFSKGDKHAGKQTEVTEAGSIC